MLLRRIFKPYPKPDFARDPIARETLTALLTVLRDTPPRESIRARTERVMHATDPLARRYGHAAIAPTMLWYADQMIAFAHGATDNLLAQLETLTDDLH